MLWLSKSHVEMLMNGDSWVHCGQFSYFPYSLLFFEHTLDVKLCGKFYKQVMRVAFSICVPMGCAADWSVLNVKSPLLAHAVEFLVYSWWSCLGRL